MVFIAKKGLAEHKSEVCQCVFYSVLCVFFNGLYGRNVAKIKYMVKKRKKYAVLGGVKVSSEQLSEWGSLGGRPRK